MSSYRTRYISRSRSKADFGPLVSKDVGRQHFHPLTASRQCLDRQPWQQKTGGTIEKYPLFEKRLTILLKSLFCAQKRKKGVFVFCREKQTAFRSAVVNIAIEPRTGAAQAQGAGSRAVNSSVRIETWIRDKRRPWNGEFNIFSTDSQWYSTQHPK